MDETTALTSTTTTAAANDRGWKQKRGYTPWIVLTVVLLGLATFYYAGPSRGSTDELDVNLKCNPTEQNEYGPSGCDNKDCAADNFVDGCKACMCFNAGNPSWCDGTRNEYYDDYYNEHGENPWGDQDRENRKCNIRFIPNDSNCNSNWQCESLCCYTEYNIYSYKKCWDGYLNGKCVT